MAAFSVFCTLASLFGVLLNFELIAEITLLDTIYIWERNFLNSLDLLVVVEAHDIRK